MAHACLPEEFPLAQPWYPSINHGWCLHYILIPKTHLLSSEKIKGEACSGTREHVNCNPTPLFVNPSQGSNSGELITLVLTQWQWFYLFLSPFIFFKSLKRKIRCNILGSQHFKDMNMILKHYDYRALGIYMYFLSYENCINISLT